MFYPEDDRYLVERETTVTHSDVVSGTRLIHSLSKSVDRAPEAT